MLLSNRLVQILVLFILLCIVVFVVVRNPPTIQTNVGVRSSSLTLEERLYQQAVKDLAAEGININTITQPEDIPVSLITQFWTPEMKSFRVPQGTTVVVMDDFFFDRLKTIAMLKLFGFEIVGAYTSCEQFLQVKQFANVYVVDNIMEGHMQFADCVPHIYTINPIAFVFASSNEDPNLGFGGKTLIQEAIEAGFDPTRVAGALKDTWLDGLAKVIFRVMSGS